MDIEEMREDVQKIVDKKRRSGFVRNSATNAEALGIIVSQYFGWDGYQILETAIAALEDANFHAEAQVVRELLEELESEYGEDEQVPERIADDGSIAR